MALFPGGHVPKARHVVAWRDGLPQRVFPCAAVHGHRAAGPEGTGGRCRLHDRRLAFDHFEFGGTRSLEARLTPGQAQLNADLFAALTARGVKLRRPGDVFGWLLDQVSAALTR